MSRPEVQTALAVQVARLYYYQNLTTDAIARELGLSRPKVSRLLSHARRTGLVEIRIHDPSAQPQALEALIQERFGVRSVKVVSVPPNSEEREWLARVASFTANHLNTLLQPDMIVGLAWGTTLAAVAEQLTPRACPELDFVQLNGAGTAAHIANVPTTELYARFASNYGGRAHLFPVPAFFDYAETKRAMWRERSVRRLLDMHARAKLLVYSVGSPVGLVPSHVYVGGQLEPADLEELRAEGVVGDIATVFFRRDGSFRDVPLNARASGPDLTLFQTAKHALCIVSGLGKVEGLRAALHGKLMTELIVDERTATALLEGPAA